MVLAVLLMCVLPVFLVDVLQTALLRLHLPASVAVLAVLAILHRLDDQPACVPRSRAMTCSRRS